MTEHVGQDGAVDLNVDQSRREQRLRLRSKDRELTNLGPIEGPLTEAIPAKGPAQVAARSTTYRVTPAAAFHERPTVLFPGVATGGSTGAAGQA